MCIKLNNNEFIRKSKEIHGEKYDYSLVEYIGSTTKVKIICSVHGTFEQRPNDHTNGGLNNFLIVQKRDSIKNDYCKDNNINLIRIKYNENVTNKLNNLIKKQ